MSGNNPQCIPVSSQLSSNSSLWADPSAQPVNATSLTSVSTSSISPLIISNKRASTDTAAITSENEPTLLYKRQKIKSGGQMEISTQMVWNNNGENFVSKSESAPLSDRNARVAKHDSQDDKMGSQPHLIELPLNGALSISNVGQSNITNSNGVHNIPNCSPPSDSSGGMSPHCVATMDYVTRLPEGCSTKSEKNSQDCATVFPDSDQELEDDDNYLDSSGAEDNVLEFECVPENDDDDAESCGEEDDQSIVSSITVGSTSSLRSLASESVNSICMNENGVAANEDGSPLYSCGPSKAPLSALTPSLFPHVPPTINFCEYNESTEKLPEEISKLLKWKFTTITPLIVRKTVANSGFKMNKKTILWGGTWGKHMKSHCFKSIKLYQKVNHFPGTFQIGRKDKLWKNFAKLQAKYGKEEFGFLPKTFVLPGDLKALKSAFDKEGVKKKWIVKPPASARGTGIQVISKWSQINTTTPTVVQRYISMPYLINNTKFDIRIYVLVTSFHPLQIFLYEDGLIRFASVQYQKTSKSLSDRYMHLTNYSVNKNSASYSHNDDAGHCQGHKWTLKTLWAYLKAQSVDTGALWSKIADLVIKTIITGELDIVTRGRRMMKSRYSCFELFGVDVILDEKLRPWLLEVNISPSLHSASSLDHSVKGPLIADTLNMAGYHIPDKLPQETQVELLNRLNLGDEVSSLCLDRRLYTRLLLPQEQSKHIKTNNAPRNQYLTEILENLTPDDIRHLIVAEDRLKQLGKYTCIFPTSETHNYFGFMERPRYYNKLFDAWETAHGGCREKGIEVLVTHCKNKKHLKVPSSFRMPKTACLPPSAQDWKASVTPSSSEQSTDTEQSERSSPDITPETVGPLHKDGNDEIKAITKEVSANDGGVPFHKDEVLPINKELDSNNENVPFNKHIISPVNKELNANNGRVSLDKDKISPINKDLDLTTNNGSVPLNKHEISVNKDLNPDNGNVPLNKHEISVNNTLNPNNGSLPLNNHEISVNKELNTSNVIQVNRESVFRIIKDVENKQSNNKIGSSSNNRLGSTALTDRPPNSRGALDLTIVDNIKEVSLSDSVGKANLIVENIKEVSDILIVEKIEKCKNDENRSEVSINKVEFNNTRTNNIS